MPEARGRPGDDPIHALFGEARRRAAAGEDVLNATLGVLTDDAGELLLLPCWREALSADDATAAAAYPPILGAPAFRHAVRADLFGVGDLAARAVVAASPGACGALHLALTTFLERGQAALLPDVHWSPYRTLAAVTGRGLETFPLFAGTRFDADAFAAALLSQATGQGRAMAILNFPCNNPTGYSLDESEWAAVMAAAAAAAEAAPTTLVLDLAYEAYAPEGGRAWVDALGGAGEASVLAAWTASKTFARYGSRVGALVAVPPDEDTQALEAAFQFGARGTWSMVNHPGQRAAAALLSDPAWEGRAEAERAPLATLLAERSEAFLAAAADAGLDHPRFDGGFFVTVRCPDPQGSAARMREEGVFVVPVTGGLRLGLCSTPAASVPRLVEATARAV